MRTTSRYPSVAPDPPAWPTLRGPMDASQALSNNFPPWVPVLEYRPMEYRGPNVYYLDPFSVKPVPYYGMHHGSGGLSNSHVSEQPWASYEANPRGPSEDVVCPPAGQVMSGHSSGGISTQVGIHPPTHVPERGIFGMHGIGRSGEENPFSSGDGRWEK